MELKKLGYRQKTDSQIKKKNSFFTLTYTISANSNFF